MSRAERGWGGAGGLVNCLLPIVSQPVASGSAINFAPLVPCLAPLVSFCFLFSFLFLWAGVGGGGLLPFDRLLGVSRRFQSPAGGPQMLRLPKLALPLGAPSRVL